MSLLPQLESDLLAAARRRRRLRVRGSIVLAVVLVVVLAVPALAVTGAFKGHKRDVISTLKGCSSRDVRIQQPPPSRKPTPPDILRLLGSMRRPATPADRPPKSLAYAFLAINPAATRLVRTDPDGTRYYLGPTDNGGWQPALPKKPGCRIYQAQQNRNPRKGKQAVCLVKIGRDERGGSCATATRIERGQTTSSGGGSTGRGAANFQISGIAPDGVVLVTAVFKSGLTLQLPVIGNVYAKSFHGAQGFRLLNSPTTSYPDRILFHYANGQIREVGTPAPRGTALRKFRRQQRLTAQRDRKAGPLPTVFPPGGAPRTVFTLRARVAFPKERSRETYRITVRGPEPGDCSRELVFVTKSEPSLSRPGAPRPKVGLLKYGFGAYTVSPGRVWCRGVYRGTVEFAPNGAGRLPRQLIGRFAFRVR
jgi:hypothetical protein